MFTGYTTYPADVRRTPCKPGATASGFHVAIVLESRLKGYAVALVDVSRDKPTCAADFLLSMPV